MKKRPAIGPEKLSIHVVNVPKPNRVILETNVDISANDELMNALKEIPGFVEVEVREHLSSDSLDTLAIDHDPDVPVEWFRSAVKACVEEFCLE